MKDDRIFLAIIPPAIAVKFGFLRGFAQYVIRFDKAFLQNYRYFHSRYTPVEYLQIGLFSYFLLSGLLTYVLFQSFSNQVDTARAIILAMCVGVTALGIMLFLSLKHPLSLAKSKAKETDKTLLYALRDLSLQINSGNTAYTALSNVAKSKYGGASEQLEFLVRDMRVGKPLEESIRHRITLTQSEYLRKAYWQLLNSFRAGSNLKEGLESVIAELDRKQRHDIDNYAKELNLWSLIYMLFSVAIPTIGLTMLVILSSFAGYSITEGTFFFFIGACVFVQIILIILVKMRRPVVQF
ncbi:MAG: type II secretion system F family protein [Candidatus Woesearchaeota archaeon]